MLLTAGEIENELLPVSGRLALLRTGDACVTSFQTTRSGLRFMTHLILCREYPPAAYPAGGIGTYAKHMARLLAEAGDTVHMVAQRWDGAPDRFSEFYNGRLIVHRIALDEPINSAPGHESADLCTLRQLASSTCPSQVFSWQASRYAEWLIETQPIDIIEAQEWEAPLYYLQVRRALGLGPARQPPCLVHLHSPSKMIFQYNEWDETLTDFQPLCRFEEYTIRAADELVCPSRYLARGVTELFDLRPGSIEVIPYPMGETHTIEREAEVWASNAICYVGRLELRKGVVEWVDAAVTVAASEPTVSFDFFGSDTSLDGGTGGSVLNHLKRRIPRDMRGRFRFRGSRSREELLRALAETSIAVVPSRWENLPFTCIEAMATGLPVLVSPNGGMSELILDGESGWIAPDQSSSGLQSALLRAIRTSPAQRKAMGERASEAVQRMCANDIVLAKHLEFRRGACTEGVSRSRSVPSPGAFTGSPEEHRTGVGNVITCLHSLDRIGKCIESVRNQTAPVPTVIVVDERLKRTFSHAMESEASASAVMSVIYTADRSPEAARRVGTKFLLASAPLLRSIIFVSQDVILEPSLTAACESAFDRLPGVGLVCPWIFREGPNGDLDAGPCSVSGSALGDVSLPQCFAVRVQALLAAQDEHEQLCRDGLASAGWSAVTYPGLLVTLLAPAARGLRISSRKRYSGMALIQNRSTRFALQWFLAAPWREKARWLERIIRHPKNVAAWMRWQIQQSFSRWRVQ